MTSNSRMLALALSGLLGMSGGLPAVGGMEKAPIPSRAPAMRPSRKAIFCARDARRSPWPMGCPAPTNSRAGMCIKVAWLRCDVLQRLN